MISEVELLRLEEKAKFSGWDRQEGVKLALRLIGEIRVLKQSVVHLQTEQFIKSIGMKMDDLECVVVEIETLEKMGKSNEPFKVDAFVDDVSARTGWEVLVNQSAQTVSFYKKKSDMGSLVGSTPI